MRRAGLIKQWLKQEAGTTAVEFAMVGSGFILLIVGILEFGRLAWTTNVVDYAVDEAARYAMLHQDALPYEVEDFARAALDSFFVPPEALNIEVQNTESSGVNFIEINGSYQFISMTSTVLPTSLSEITLAINSRRPIYLVDDGEEE